jgi:serine/threonine-protein kinase
MLMAVFTFLIEVIEEMIRIRYLHRDIKPANIMATGSAERPYVILDMGIAYRVQGTALTQGPTPPGTLRYMAPELLAPDYKDVMDFRCDLYSSGLSIYELASGSHPFAPNTENDYATVYRIMNQRPDPLETRRPDLPRRFCQIIDRCIKKNLALRYARIDLLRHDLQEAQQ